MRTLMQLSIACLMVVVVSTQVQPALSAAEMGIKSGPTFSTFRGDMVFGNATALTADIRFSHSAAALFTDSRFFYANRALSFSLGLVL